MAEESYFKNALAGFTFEVASGGAIRHLSDRGYTVNQIMKMLDFPTPYDRVQQTVWDHLRETGGILFDEPGNGQAREQYEYVTEYDQYGRKSFRRVTAGGKEDGPVCWREHVYEEIADGKLSDYLAGKWRDNGAEYAYASCDFGLRMKREPEKYERMLRRLEEPERDYIRGLPWERRMVWHRLDERMQRIIVRLYACGEYCGTCCFLKTGEKVRLPGA